MQKTLTNYMTLNFNVVQTFPFISQCLYSLTLSLSIDPSASLFPDVNNLNLRTFENKLKNSNSIILFRPSCCRFDHPVLSPEIEQSSSKVEPDVCSDRKS